MSDLSDIQAEQRALRALDELRKQYSQDALQKLYAKGQALKSPRDGHIGFPCATIKDVSNAAKAAGLTTHWDLSTVKAHIKKNYKRLGSPHIDGAPAWLTDDQARPDVNLVNPAGAGGRSKPRRRSGGSVMGTEYRTAQFSNLEARAGRNSDEILITGEPIIYHTQYEVHDAAGVFLEEIRYGSMRGCDTRECKFLINHNSDGIALASVAAGTLTLTDTPKALTCSMRLDARSQLANDVSSAIARSDMNAMSIGMKVSQDQWSSDYSERSISGLSKLLDVSVVNWAASPTTSISVAERMFAGMAPESRALLTKLVRQANMELREGKTISAATAQKLQQALDHVGAAGTHISDLLAQSAIEGDGTITGGALGFGGPGAGVTMGPDASGRSASAQLRELIRERLEFDRHLAVQKELDYLRCLKEAI